MSEHDAESPGALPQPPAVNPWYALAQLSKSLTSLHQGDAASRERARVKLAQWKAVLSNLLAGSVDYGSRTPLKDVPAWATPEVVTGGFVTGELLAGGPLQAHEKALLTQLPDVEKGTERHRLNGYFLSDAGLQELQQCLKHGRYEIEVPEEAALLVVAWLVEQGHADAARELITALAGYFDRLRFYPLPSDKTPLPLDSRLHLKTAAETAADFEAVRPNQRILAQQEAVEVWAPLYDQMIALFAATVVNGEPCVQFPTGWAEQASLLLEDHTRLRNQHRQCSRFERPKTYYAQVLTLLQQTATAPQALTRRDIGRLRTILNAYIAKRGLPGSASCVAQRARQRSYVANPTHKAIAAVIVGRLSRYPATEGIDDIEPLSAPVTAHESLEFRIREGTSIPATFGRKIARCLNETPAVLIERKLITSGEVLAHLLPQLTSGLRAQGLGAPALRGLYSATYQAFRRRRSLLLFHLNGQVRLEELPWVDAMERFRKRDATQREISLQALQDVVALTLCAFPHVIVPNKLLQELRALAKGAELDLPLVDELAADIFMGEFSGKFVAAAHLAARLLEGSLYAAYFDIDCPGILALQAPPESRAAKPHSSWRSKRADALATLCAQRAGVELGSWQPAQNGMIIEQQQILTTQNLAALFVALDLRERIAQQLPDMARRCFEWICVRQQRPHHDHHANLLTLKNTAYAWRQMIFYLSLQDRSGIADFLRWADAHLTQQSPEFRARFAPALLGLVAASTGSSPEIAGGRRFLGWSNQRHWLMSEPAQHP